MSKFKPLEIAPWAKAELRQQRRAERRAGFSSGVRVTFVVLFFATVVVFIHNHQVGALTFTTTQIHRVADKATLSDHLRDGALNYEKSINSINEPAHPQPANP